MNKWKLDRVILMFAHFLTYLILILGVQLVQFLVYLTVGLSINGIVLGLFTGYLVYGKLLTFISKKLKDVTQI